MSVKNKHSRPSTKRASVLAFLIAAAIAVAWGSIVQTQFNIAALDSIGASITLAERVKMTASDLIGFTPIYAVIVAAGLLLALPVAALIAVWWPARSMFLYVVAGMLGIATAIRIVDMATPAPTLIAATRETAGWLLMAMGGALGGAWFARSRSLGRL
jgi:hypothetical protein